VFQQYFERREIASYLGVIVVGFLEQFDVKCPVLVSFPQSKPAQFSASFSAVTISRLLVINV